MSFHFIYFICFRFKVEGKQLAPGLRVECRALESKDKTWNIVVLDFKTANYESRRTQGMMGD